MGAVSANMQIAGAQLGGGVTGGGLCPGGMDKELLFLWRPNFISPWGTWEHPVEESTSCCYPKNCTYRDSWSYRGKAKISLALPLQTWCPRGQGTVGTSAEKNKRTKKSQAKPTHSFGLICYGRISHKAGEVSLLTPQRPCCTSKDNIRFLETWHLRYR